ncbi:MAG: DUF3810 domain-containing protein [Eubacteriales bacterium]
MSKIKKIKECVPVASVVIFAVTLVSAVLYLCYRNSAAFADFFNYHMSAPFRALISSLTTIFPFSVAETAIILSPLILALLIYLAVKSAKKGTKASLRYIFTLLSAICCIFISFVWTYSSGFYTTSIDKKLGMEDRKISKEELYDTAVILTERLNELSDKIVYSTSGSSIMPYSYDELSDKICDSYDGIASEYKIIRNFTSRAKPILLSEPFTYTHISGVYSYITGESNINVNYPDFIVASSAAHELAHQRGIARENEANFIAFLACITSDDDFLKYSGYLDVYGYVTNALYSADYELYKEVYAMLDPGVRNDLRSYWHFFQKYQDSAASQVTDKINDSYLQSNGQTEGSKSYGMVTDLVCVYLLGREK